MLFAKKSGAVDWLVVGLGNPGMTYEETRHNAGYGALTARAKDTGIAMTKHQFRALTGLGTVDGQKVLLLFPETFMNNSGEAVRAAMAFYKVPPERLLVFSDDISLAVGAVRVRKKGSDGGQKGLRSIIGLIGSEEFARVRIGIGAKPHPSMDLADWVLSKFGKDDRPLMEDAYDKAAAAARLILNGKIEEAMNRYSH